MKIHLDLDCFFVSAERSRYPFLKKFPTVVVKGSDKKIFSEEKKKEYFIGKTGAFNSILEFENRYDKNNILSLWKDEFIDKNGFISGIVIAKSYEAKAKGIKTGTPLKDALNMCKNLQIIPSDHLFYQLLSQKLKKYLCNKIPLVEQYSIDEFFGDLEGYIDDKNVYDYICFLQKDILKRFDLPISIGASKSKWIAKLATSKAKPFGLKIVSDKQIKEFTKDIFIRDFPGIGKKIEKRLNAYRIHTLGELQDSPHLLKSYGKMGKDLYAKINGEDNEKINPYLDRRAIGISRNFKSIFQREEIYRRGTIMARYLSFSILRLELKPTTYHFKLRFSNGLKNAYSLTLDRIFSEKLLLDLTKKSIEKLDIYPNLKIHYISINASNFINEKKYKNFSLLHFDDDEKFFNLSKSISFIREKYGIDIIKYARENVLFTNQL